MDFKTSRVKQVTTTATPIAAAPAAAVRTIRVTASAAPTTPKLMHIAPQTSALASSSSSTLTSTTTTVSKTCTVCQKASQQPANQQTLFNDNNQILIDCHTCGRSSHPNCLELNPDLVDWVCIRQYEWQCMDCKHCSTCTKSHDEEKMMFCDRCDRGFHTYCVGVGQVPEGAWMCAKCKQFKERLASINEKISAMKTATATPPPAPRHSLHSALASGAKALTTPSSAAVSKTLRPKFQNASYSELDDRSAGSPHTPGADKPRGRGRPPGSLNKPKDPNSPKKLL
jgi:hypothetical protein